ncbi:hypothetical protein ACI6Q2_21145 [Chitinophagaceae bacterium LWZ2-11]
MKNIYKALSIVLVTSGALLFMQSCKKVLGLDLQTDSEHTPYVLNPNINKSAWSYLKYRSGADTTNPNYKTDTIFKSMYNAVVYSGMDTLEYTKPGRTFIFLHNSAVLSLTSTTPKVPTTTCYWGYYQVSNPKRPATSWSDYTPNQVKQWLQYLIIPGGQYSFDNLNTVETIVPTLLPPNTDTLNPQSLMVLEIVNDQSAKIRINGFVGSLNYTDVRTGGIISTNGPIHVVDLLTMYGKQ